MKSHAHLGGSTLPGRALALAALITLLDSGPALAQCALCRDAVAASPPQIREAMNLAIIGLAFAPYVVGGLAAWILLPALRARVRAWFRSRTLHGTGNPP